MVDPGRCDFRDALVAIAFVNNGIEKMKLDSEQLYEKSIGMSNAKMAELLSSYKRRKPHDKRLETAAGYTEFQSEFGPGFIQCGYEKYEPKNNLVNIGFKISDYIEKEKYQGAFISAAESLSLVWLNGKNNNELKTILRNSSGTIFVRAYPKEEFCQKWTSQMFLLYLIECKNQKDAQRLVEIGNASKSKSHSKIVTAVDDIFCILITRSTAIGVDSFEDSKSIERFKEPLEKLIKENKNA
jgi:hypothetical protein